MISSCSKLSDIASNKNDELEKMSIVQLHLLKSIDIPPSVTQFSIDNCKELVKLNGIENCSLKSLKMSGLSSIQTLKVPTTLTYLSLNFFDQLNKIDNISSSKILELTLFKCENLISFDLSQCITKLQIDTCHLITSLDLHTYELKELEISSCANLISLNLPVSITEINIYHCDNLIQVNNLEKLPLSISKVYPLVINLHHPILPKSFDDFEGVNKLTQEIIDSSSYESSGQTPSLPRTPKESHSPLFDKPLFEIPKFNKRHSGIKLFKSLKASTPSLFSSSGDIRAPSMKEMKTNIEKVYEQSSPIKSPSPS